MNAYAKWIAHHPWIVIAATILATLAFGSGFALIEEDDSGLESFLSADEGPGRALALLETNFPDTGRPRTVQVVARGDITDRDAVVAFIDTIDATLADPAIASSIDRSEPVTSYAHLIAQLSRGTPDDLTQTAINEIVASLDDASNQDPRTAALREFLVVEDGTPTAGLGFIVQQRGGLTATELNDAANSIDEQLAASSYGADIEVSTFSEARFQAAFEDGLADTALLFPIALLLILATLWLFYRTITDTIITFAGVLLTVLWFTGAQGLLGPRGLELTGGTGLVTTVIPVMLVGLTVDYALQLTGRYREHLADGNDERDGHPFDPSRATERSLTTTGTAIFVGAATTAIAFMTNLAGPLPPIRDFGILAAVGIVAGAVVMTSFVPAVRVLVDRRRISAGRADAPRPVGASVSMLRNAAAGLARASASRPTRTIAVAGVGLAFAGILAAGVSTTFSNTDFLPDDHAATQNLTLLRDQLGGARSTATVLIEGDTNDATVVASIDELADHLRSDRRPATIAADPIPGPGVSSATASTDTVAILTVPVRIDRSDSARTLITDVEDAWTHPTATIEVTGDDLLPTIISDEISRTQNIAIGITIAAALVLLVGYFAFTTRRPVLGLTAVVPVAGVLVIVIGLMRLLGLVYNPLTAILTTLTIGLGVDYMLHLTHRYDHARQDGHPPTNAAHHAAATTGSALTASAITTISGFIILTLSPLPAMLELGALTAAVAGAALLLSLTLLPALLAATDRRATRDPANTAR